MTQSEGVSFYFDSGKERTAARNVITAAGLNISSSDAKKGKDPDMYGFILKDRSWPDADRVDAALKAGFDGNYQRI